MDDASAFGFTTNELNIMQNQKLGLDMMSRFLFAARAGLSDPIKSRQAGRRYMATLHKRAWDPLQPDMDGTLRERDDTTRRVYGYWIWLEPDSIPSAVNVAEITLQLYHEMVKRYLAHKHPAKLVVAPMAPYVQTGRCDEHAVNISSIEELCSMQELHVLPFIIPTASIRKYMAATRMRMNVHASKQ